MGDLEQSNDLLHGVTLKAMLEHLVENRGWGELGRLIRIGCFNESPSIASSLKFLRKTEWARLKVERLYLEDRQKAERNRKRNERRASMRAYRAAQEEGGSTLPNVSDDETGDDWDEDEEDED